MLTSLNWEELRRNDRQKTKNFSLQLDRPSCRSPKMTSNTSSKEPDPLFRQIQVPAGTSGRERTGKGEGKTVASNETTMALLKQTATSGISAREIYVERIEHKPLSLLPNDSIDRREQRRLKRLQGLKRKRKPKPLSAKEKRELRIYDLPKTLRFVTV